MDDEALPDLFILNRHGTPVHEPSLPRWVAWFRRLENRRVAATSLGSGGFVSTIFLGFDRSGAGRLFQTTLKQAGVTVDEETYDSREDALLGHDRHCARARGEASDVG